MTKFGKICLLALILMPAQMAGIDFKASYGDTEGIVFGEIVSRHEFGIDKGVFPAPDSCRVAFYRKDERAVAQYTFINTQTPGTFETVKIRYPMNGRASEHISIGVRTLADGSDVYLQTEGEMGPEQYLACITWSPDSRYIYVQALDRAQQNMRLIQYDAATGAKTAVILEEHSDTWVEPSEPLHWLRQAAKPAGRQAANPAGSLSPERFIYTTDNRDGFRNLYVVTLGNEISVSRLCAFEGPMDYVANDGRRVYFTGNEGESENNYLYAVAIPAVAKAGSKISVKPAKPVLLTPEKGWHSIAMAQDCSAFTDVWETVDTPPRETVRDSRSGKILETHDASGASEDKASIEITIGKVLSADGRYQNNYRLVKPAGFKADAKAKYPLILYVYGGPHSQLVKNKYHGQWRKWEQIAAQRGFATLVIDGRGTKGHGAAYEHCIYRRCGECESQDQMAGLKEVISLNPWIDTARIAVDGWSYGGFMSLTMATKYPDTFKACVAGGPVIDWRFYEVMYGERYMGRYIEGDPESEAVFDANSLIGKASLLKARTLIVQGALDDTVLPVNAASFLQKCADSGVQVRYFEYPHAKHNMRGSDRVHLLEMKARFFEENL